MKMKRYVATDMRQALNRVREEMGPDAVILESRRLNGQVEVCVAVDYDVEAGATVAARDPVVATDTTVFAPRADAAPPSLAQALARFDSAVEPTPVQPAAAPTAEEGINTELRNLRRMLETQLATLAWNDLTRRAPLATELLRELSEIGFSRDLAAQVADAVPASLDLARARRLAVARLADRIAVTGDRWTEFGGVVALVGAPGAGKTTALARIAAQWVMRHGPRQAALICADSSRFGAQEQIAQFGRLLATPTYVVDDLGELPSLLARLESTRLILIDTEGVSAREGMARHQANALLACSERMELGLCLATSTQIGALEEMLSAFSGCRGVSALLTRTDECVTLGGTLSAVIKAELPLSYVSEGTRLEDGLRPARSLDLIDFASQLAERNGATADEDLLARRFGGHFNAV